MHKQLSMSIDRAVGRISVTPVHNNDMLKIGDAYSFVEAGAAPAAIWSLELELLASCM